MALLFSKVSTPPQEFSYLLNLHAIPGTERLDTVTIAPGVAIFQQSIGVASNSSGISPFDGILG
jgi:hypothetical protein